MTPTPCAPPVRYFGGKPRLAPIIADLLPPHTHYVEPYAGSLAVLLAKSPSPMETVNDLDRMLMTFWRVLRDRPDDLAEACELTPHSRADYEQAARAIEHPDVDDVERARMVWVLLNFGRGSVVPGGTAKSGWKYGKNVHSTTGRDRSRDDLRTFRARLVPAAGRIRHVHLECRPALEVVAAYGTESSVCLYVDPPYLGETRSRDGGYTHDMRAASDHEQLLAALRECSAAVVLSGYDSRLYSDTLADWHRHEMSAYSYSSPKAGTRTEVLWSNRPLGQQPTLWGASA